LDKTPVQLNGARAPDIFKVDQRQVANAGQAHWSEPSAHWESEMRSLLLFLSATLASALDGPVLAQAPSDGPPIPVIGAATDRELRDLYRHLIASENAHDIGEVRRIIWSSPNALFVAKTRTPAEGNWAGFWGADVVVSHIHELFQSVFVMDPDFPRERIVLLSPTVAETYVPVRISVAYAGQTGKPKPFLMIVDWVRVGGGWRMATDIALPIPPPPSGQ
jgi:hypothetical protein